MKYKITTYITSGDFEKIPLVSGLTLYHKCVLYVFDWLPWRRVVVVFFGISGSH
jgi:hypothetical protein